RGEGRYPSLGKGGGGVVVTIQAAGLEKCYSGLQFVCFPIRYSEMKIKNYIFYLHFTHLAQLCWREDRRRFGNANKNFVFCFAFRPAFVIFATPY
ncbi:MAG: hypothetical protein J5529_11205, partial [Prevotella sp.]|nr:hypothetical protein [Prevotella sp.]